MGNVSSVTMKVVAYGEGVALKRWRSPPKSVVVPAAVKGRCVCAVLEGCFRKCKSLRDFRFEDGSCVKKIEKRAFRECSSLCSFVWPRGVDTIPESCFFLCNSLRDFRFEDASCVKKIENWAFDGCSSLCSFVWPRGVDTIPEFCFFGCESLRDFRFEEGSCVKKIEKKAFSGCSSLSTFCLPQSLKFIGADCFSECVSLRTVVLECGSKLGREDLKDAGLGSRVNIVFAKEEPKKEQPKKEQPKKEQPKKEQPKIKPLSDFLIDLSSLERQSAPSHLVSGGTGRIKLFKRKGDGKLVVGKFLDSDDSGISQKSFEREISNLIAIDHPCVVTLSGYALPCSLTKHRFAVFTEYVSGGSLSDAISALCSPGSGCPWFNSTARATIVVGLVHCMRYVHSLGIIHRDLKPSNVLLDESHHPLVCDFGSSRALSSDATLTQSPQLTAYYAAPEFSDEDVAYDSNVDVYSFGVMLYEIVTGQLALRHLNQYQVLQFIIRGKRPEIPDKVLPFTRALIKRCWSGDPSERPSFSDIYSDLVKHHFRLFEDVDSGAVASYAQSLPQ